MGPIGFWLWKKTGVFVKGEWEVCDAGLLSPTFFRVLRSESGLDSYDSRRIGLGLSPVGGCRLPLKVRGHPTRLEIDPSNPGFGLILGDSGRGIWFKSRALLQVRSWLVRVILEAPAGLEKN